ncbi:hypothetical protein FQN54_002328 [Arachnomyces sp. PD_36]|nr:hypothetical protein FQN54_002328 [Arachnomyces sp. PD_36]
MSWDLEELAAQTGFGEHRRPASQPAEASASASRPQIVQNPFIVTSAERGATRPNQRPQPYVNADLVRPVFAARLSAVASGSPCIRAHGHAELDEPLDLATTGRGASAPASVALGAHSNDGSQPDDEPAQVTTEPSATSHSRSDSAIRVSENPRPLDNIILGTSAPISTSTFSGTSTIGGAQHESQTFDCESQYSVDPASYQTPLWNHDPTNLQSQYNDHGGVYVQDEYPAPRQYTAPENSYHDHYEGGWMGGPADNDGYYSPYPPNFKFGQYGNWEYRRGHRGNETYGVHGPKSRGRNHSKNKKGLWDRKPNLGHRGNPHNWENTGFGWNTPDNHSRHFFHEAAEHQVPELNFHIFQPFNYPPISQPPPHIPEPHFMGSGFEAGYMPPNTAQQGFGNPDLHPPYMAEEVSMMNYGFPFLPPQIPPPAGHNAHDPIPRPQTQIRYLSPFPQPPITSGGPYGQPQPASPQPGYYPHNNASPSPIPQLISATSVPHETMSLEMVTHDSVMPFENGALKHQPSSYGVATIRNIPYAVTKQEIVHFIGRDSNMITPDIGCAIHIIMERSTSKTMDCYVEFKTQADAEAAVSKVNRNICEHGRIPRLGSRHVDFETSSQDKLMKDLFPRAKQIIWNNGVPYLGPSDDPYSTGFQGFFTHEEIFLLIRHAEHPQRSPFSMKCLWRAYECTISTLKKFPWFATTMYTIEDRNQLFAVTLRHLTALHAKIEKGKVVGLDRKLLHEVLDAGLKCPGFNERQKFALVMASNVPSEARRLSIIARYWPFDTLSMKPGTSDGTMMHYAYLICKGLSVKDISTQTLPNSYRPQYQGESPFGRIWLEWGFNNTHHKFQTAVDYEMQVARSLVVEGYTANALMASNAISSQPQPLGQQEQAQIQAQEQGQIQLASAVNTGNGHLAPPAPTHFQNFGGNLSSAVTGPSFFPQSGAGGGNGQLPTQMATISPSPVPMWPQSIAGINPAGNFNMPMPQVPQQHQQFPVPMATGPTATPSNASPNRGNRGGTFIVSSSQPQPQNQHQSQGHGQNHGQSQGQQSHGRHSQNSNRSRFHYRHRKNDNSNNNTGHSSHSQQKRH